MGYRRSPHQVTATRDWAHFVERNAHVIRAAGLPPSATESVQTWDDFVSHGFIATDPGEFTVDQLDSKQYAALVVLIRSYFDAGYEFFTPMALRAEDQAALRAAFT